MPNGCLTGAWYNLFEYVYTLANSGYRGLQCQDDMMADDVVSRPAYGFNSSYQFNDIAIPNNTRTSFAWYLMYKTIDNCNTALAIQGDTEALRQAPGAGIGASGFLLSASGTALPVYLFERPCGSLCPYLYRAHYG